MLRCMICRFEVELDDVALSGRSGRCVCLRCYGRETGTLRPLPRPLQRELHAALAHLPTEPDPWAENDSA
ncbi:MAG: hypothetical protein C4290_00445 [Chloroflexota bacterium]